MKKELDYIRNKYKKQNKRYITKYGIELREETLLDSKLEDVLNIELYCGYNQSLRDEYGSAVKIMNHIELNVGFDRFKEIVDYCHYYNINRNEFIEYIKNNDMEVPEIVNENKDDDKKLDTVNLLGVGSSFTAICLFITTIHSDILPEYIIVPPMVLSIFFLISFSIRLLRSKKI